jgi:ketosteroid isomerase-like protein
MLEELIAKQAIHELVLKYCRAINRKDYAALASLYHDDAVDDHGGMFSGTAKAYIEWLPGILEGMKVTSHRVSNHLITVQGDYAEGEVVTVAYHLTHDDQEIIIGGRYLDKYCRTNGVWQFSHRKIVLDWNQIQPSRCDFTSPVVAGTPVGDRLENDPATTFFNLLHTHAN